MSYLRYLVPLIYLGLYLLSAELLFQDLNSRRVSLALNLSFRVLAISASLSRMAAASELRWGSLAGPLLCFALAVALLWPLPLGLADKRYIASLFLLCPPTVALCICLSACLWAICREAWRSGLSPHRRFPFLPYLCLCTWPLLSWQCWQNLKLLFTS